MKFNWSHGHSTPKLVKVHGGALGDTYFKPQPVELQDRLAGSQRGFLRAALGRAGVHPRSTSPRTDGRTTSADTSSARRPTFPRSTTSSGAATASPSTGSGRSSANGCSTSSWGRLLYDPATPDSVFQANSRGATAPGAANLLRAYALASNTQLRLASLYDSRWDFTLYSEGFLALQGETTKYIGVDALIKQPTMDPAYVSVADYVKSLAREPGVRRRSRHAAAARRPAGTRLPRGVAARRATIRCRRRRRARVRSRGREGLGQSRPASGRKTARRGGAADDSAHRGCRATRRAPSGTLRSALAAWDEVIRITRPLYKDMKPHALQRQFLRLRIPTTCSIGRGSAARWRTTSKSPGA